MVMLSAPHLVNQLMAGGSYPHADCGEACSDSVLIDAGHADTVGEVERTIGGNLSGGTYTSQLATALSRLGVSATAISSVGEVDAGLANKHRTIVEIPSDHMGNPDPGSALGHFILVYGFDGTNYHFMNPLGGKLQTVSSTVLKQCEQERGLRAVSINVVMPADAGQPAPTPQPVPAPAPAPAPGQPSVPASTPPVHENFKGTVVASGTNIWGSPGGGQLFGYHPNKGVVLNFNEYSYSTAVYDSVAKQWDHRWYHIASGGWVASARINGNASGSHP